MDQVTKIYFAHLLALAITVISIPCESCGNPSQGKADIWLNYSLDQKEILIDGFVQCYRISSNSKDAFSQIDYDKTIKIINQTVASGADITIGNLILQTIKKLPRDKSDIDGEHWSGPYGFSRGLWWRGIYDREREAYVQGVFWCAESAGNINVNNSDRSVQKSVSILDDWYVISDDDWKDRRSNLRVDIPVFLAMQRTGIISVGRAKTTR